MRTWIEKHKRRNPRTGKFDVWTGRYEARWIDPAGKRRRKIYARKGDARDFLADLKASRLRGIYHDPRLGKTSLGAWWESWRADADALSANTGRPAPSTLAKYDNLYRLYVSQLSALPLGTITRGDVQDWVVRVAQQSSAFRAEDAFKLLRLLLNKARSRDLIVRDVCEFVDVPRGQRKTPKVLTPEEIERLAGAVGERWRALIFVAAYCSLRFSEIVGLRVSRIDFLRRKLYVEEKIVEVRGKRHQGDPKTDASRRAVDVPPIVLEEIAEHLRKYPAEHNDYVFRTPGGQPIRRANFYSTVWWPALEQIGLRVVERSLGEKPVVRETFKLKDLRHTGNTLGLIATGDLQGSAGPLGARQRQADHRHVSGACRRPGENVRGGTRSSRTRGSEAAGPLDRRWRRRGLGWRPLLFPLPGYRHSCSNGS